MMSTGVKRQGVAFCLKTFNATVIRHRGRQGKTDLHRDQGCKRFELFLVAELVLLTCLN